MLFKAFSSVHQSRIALGDQHFESVVFNLITGLVDISLTNHVMSAYYSSLFYTHVSSVEQQTKC